MAGVPDNGTQGADSCVLARREADSHAGVDNTARIYDVVAGAELAVLRGHEDDVLSATYSSNGWIVTASSDRSLRLWRAFETTQELIDDARALMPRQLTPKQRAVLPRFLV